MARGTISWTAVRAPAVAALGALVFGCGGGIGPGDYAVLRLAEATPSYSSGCTQTKATNTIDTGVTEYIFAGPKNTYYLDSGASGTMSDVLAGSSTSGGYSFSGKGSTVTTFGQDTQTTTSNVTVTMTVSGDAVSGTATVAETTSCSGPCMGFNATACTTTTSFSGSIIQNIQLQQNVP